MQKERGKKSCSDTATDTTTTAIINDKTDVPLLSIVEYFPDDQSSDCGYCKQRRRKREQQKREDMNETESSLSFSHGFIAHAMSAEAYERAINFGFRRSGRWVYKPTKDKSCCVLCTIRLPVREFEETKGQRYARRKFERFLVNDEEERGNDDVFDELAVKEEDDEEDDNEKSLLKAAIVEAVGNAYPSIVRDDDWNQKLSFEIKEVKNNKMKNSSDNCAVYMTSVCFALASKMKDDIERVANLVHANIRKIENWRCEVSNRGFINFHSLVPERRIVIERKKEKKMKASVAKTVREKAMVKKEKKRKKVFRVEVLASEFRQEDYELWKRYQAVVHKDKPSKLKVSSYTNFLCDTPLVSNKNNNNDQGSKHFRYFIDDELVAVGVCDILPTCLSSVYFFSDPDLQKLELGKFSALYEIDWVKQKHETNENFKYYYMGYYIHDCVKMKYKGEYKPSELRCPTTGKWVLLDDKKTLERLNAHSFKLYHNEEEEEEEEEEEDEEDDITNPLNRQFIALLRNNKFQGVSLLSPQLHAILASSVRGRKQIETLRKFRKELGGDNSFAVLIGDMFDDDEEEDDEEEFEEDCGVSETSRSMSE